MNSTTKAGQRIAALLDENSFVEIGALVTARATDFDLKQKDAPSDGVITGYGLINGAPVYVYSQDASVFGGSVGEMHAKKIVSVYDLAMKTGTPVIGIIDSTGLRLQEGADALNAFGQIYAKQIAASGLIPQISIVMGGCGGGLALIPACTDFTFMEEKSGHMFVNSPNAVNGNDGSKNDTSAAAYRAKNTLNVDVVATEAEIFDKVRDLMSYLPSNCDSYDAAAADCTDDLNRVLENMEGCVGDTVIALSQIADDGAYFEVKADYAKNMTTGFIRLDGMTIGCIANRTEEFDAEGNKVETYDAVLTAKGCDKATEMIRFCDAFGIPVLTLTNVKGYGSCEFAETNVATKAAKMMAAFAEADVPKVNVVIGQGFGSAFMAMNSKAIGCDMTFAWPNAQIGSIDAKHAAQIMYANESAEVIAEKAAAYAAAQANVSSAAARGYVDTIIDPAATRAHVIAAFEMLYTKSVNLPDKKHGAI